MTKLARSKRTSVRLAQRARIVLLAADGMQNKDIAGQLGVGRVQVSRWRERYAQSRLAGIERDLPRGAPPVKVDAALARSRVETAHRARFQSFARPEVRGETRRYRGAVHVAPEHALVLCCFDPSQVQALDRTQPGLPLKKGRAATLTHDYKRNGTTTLFAALNVLDGQVIGQCQPHHTHIEWLKFLRQIDRETPKDKTLHLIADNYATHKHPVVQDWLAKHPRFNMHFTPTSASWLNRVERFFRDITTERLRRGVLTSVPELVAAIDEYVAHHNTNPKPFIWTTSARDILQKVIRANARLSSKQNATLH